MLLGDYCTVRLLLYITVWVTVTSAKWEQWSPWSQCSRSCGNGYQLRVRKCSNPWEKSCVHNSREFERKTCSTPCAFGEWSTWTGWSLCTTSCKRARQRFCVDISNPRRALSADSCGEGVNSWEEKCSNGLCNNGQWTDWMPWSCQCLHQGLVPKRIRFRRCAGRFCPGKTYETGRCNEDEEEICYKTHKAKVAKEEYDRRLKKNLIDSFGRAPTKPTKSTSLVSSRYSPPFRVSGSPTQHSPSAWAKPKTTTMTTTPKPTTTTTTTTTVPLTSPTPAPTTISFEEPLPPLPFSTRSPFSFHLPKEDKNNWHGNVEEGDSLISHRGHAIASESDEIFNNRLFSKPIKSNPNRTVFWGPNQQTPYPSSGEEINLIDKHSIINNPNRTFDLSNINQPIYPTDLEYSAGNEKKLEKSQIQKPKQFKGYNVLAGANTKDTNYYGNKNKKPNKSINKSITKSINRSGYQPPTGLTLVRTFSKKGRADWSKHVKRTNRKQTDKFKKNNETDVEYEYVDLIEEQSQRSRVREIHWTRWGTWSGCDCLTGHQYRLRLCAYPRPAAIFIHAHCPGNQVSRRPCVPGSCFVVNGGWGSWSAWSDCPQNCGPGSQWRVRLCDNPLTINGGRSCPGQARDIRLCTNRRCSGTMMPGGWSDWSGWSTCATSCGQGVRSRTRHCTNPWPANGGTYCQGDNVLSDKCSNALPCPEFSVGSWSTWSPWSQCTCHNTVSQAWRSCTAPRPQGPGEACVGAMYRSQHCVTPDFCFNDNPIVPLRKGRFVLQ